MRLSPLGRASLARLADLKDSRRGDTCVILGNGPSLRNFDVRSLDGIAAFCLNRGYLLWEGTGRKPAYYVAVNDLVIEQFGSEIAQLGSTAFLPWLHRSEFEGAADVAFFETRIDDAFITDVRRGIAPGATVTVAALQLAYHIGFSTVVLIGVDHRFETPGRPHQEIRQRGDDPNHFRADYFDEGTVWNLPDLAHSERGYLAAKEAFRLDGRRVVNATRPTALNVFEHTDLDLALSNV